MKKISTAHLILLVSVLLQFIVSVILQIVNVNIPMPLVLLLSQGTIILPFGIYCVWKKVNVLELIRFRKIKISTAVLAVAVGLVSYPVVVFLNMISMMFVENVMLDVISEVLAMGLGSGLVFMALLPALVEETVFRGVIYNSYSKRRPLLGIFLSAMLFGLMHMNFNQLPYAFYLGIILALLMEASDSILTPMILHFTMNATSTLISFLSMGTAEQVETETTDIRSMLMESYRESMALSGVEISEAQLAEMIPYILAGMILGLAIFAAAAMGIVFVLIYAVFRSNNRKLSEVFRADHSDTAFYMDENGRMRKNRIWDPWLILFILYTLTNCILSVL